MVVLITGATGFIGQHLCKELRKKGIRFKTLGRNEKNAIRVNKPEKKESRFYQKIFSQNNINKIIHLAAISRETEQLWEKYEKVNIDWTKKLYQALSKTKQKNKTFVFMSTVGVYGMPPHKNPCKESDQKKPNGKYHKSKSIAEEKLLNMENKNTRLIIMRSSIVYSRNDPGSSLKKMHKLFLSGKYPLVKNAKHHFLNVDNLMEFCINSLKKGRGVYNVADKKPVKSEQLFELFKKHGSGGKKSLPKPLLKILLKLAFFERIKTKLGILGDWYYDIDKSNKIYNPQSTLTKLEEYLDDGSWQ